MLLFNSSSGLKFFNSTLNVVRIIDMSILNTRTMSCVKLIEILKPTVGNMLFMVKISYHIMSVAVSNSIRLHFPYLYKQSFRLYSYRLEEYRLRTLFFDIYFLKFKSTLHVSAA
jgi:hypothetical protein